MIIRKSENADLERKRFILFEIGLIVTLAVVLLAFNWKSYERTVYDLTTRQSIDLPEEIIPITEQPPPEPPKVKTPVSFSTIKIVDDQMEVDDEIKIDAEADQSTVIPDYQPVNFDEPEEESVQEDEIFLVVESQPSFPGGSEALYKYLADNLKYPREAREAGIQGRVFVSFVVEKDGSISHVTVLRGIGGGCDEEAVRVVLSMPKWISGKQRGIPVRVQFNLPIKFTLQ